MSDDERKAHALLEERGFKGLFTLKYRPEIRYTLMRWKCEIKKVWVPMPGGAEGWGDTAFAAAFNALACRPVLVIGGQEE